MRVVNKEKEFIDVAVFIAGLAYDLEKIWGIKNKEYRSMLRGLAYCIHSNREQGCAELKKLIDQYIIDTHQLSDGADSDKIKGFEAIMKVVELDDEEWNISEN